MKVVLMLVVAILMGIGFLAKFGKFADNAIEAVPVATGAVRGAVVVANSNNQGGTLSMSAEQMQIAKEVFGSDKLMFYATPELQNLLKKAHQIDERLARTTHEPMGCEFYEDEYFVGAMLDDFVAKNLQVSATNNIVRITFVHGSYEGNYDDYGAGLVEFFMKGNQIDDVRYGGSDDPKKIPTKTEKSLRADAQKMVDTSLCAWE